MAPGPDDAMPLVFHTGTPSGLVWNEPLADAASLTLARPPEPGPA